MSIFAKGLVAAMEDETQAAELAIDKAGAESAEADLVEATDISADVEAGTAEVDQATADADTLERIADTAETAEAEGGLDPVAAEIAEVAVESIYARLGVQRSSYPALESFSGKTGRKRATQLAIEDIKETVKKIWAAVVNAFQKIVDFVKNMWKKLMDGNRKLLARINALQKKAAASKGETSGNVKSSGITKPAGSADKAGIMKAVAGVETELVSMEDWTQKIVANLGGLFNGIDISQSGGDESFLDKSKAIMDVYKSAGEITKFNGAILGPRIESKFGEAAQSVSTPKAAWEALKDFGLTIKENIPFTDKPEIEALSRNEINSILKDAEKVIKHNLGQSAAEAKFNAGIMKAVESAKKLAETAPDGEGKSAIVEDSRIAQRAITVCGNNAVKMFSFAAKTGVDIAKAGIDYAERSLATVKAAE